MPFGDFEHDRVGLILGGIAHDLRVWTQRLLLTCALTRCESKRSVRYRPVHVASRRSFHARRKATVRIPTAWPLGTSAHRRVHALPRSRAAALSRSRARLPMCRRLRRAATRGATSAPAPAGPPRAPPGRSAPRHLLAAIPRYPPVNAPHEARRLTSRTAASRMARLRELVGSTALTSRLSACGRLLRGPWVRANCASVLSIRRR
jgi:hypothetical protein